MGSTQSISFRKRNEADEVYILPILINNATLDIRASTVMVEHIDNNCVRIIAGNIPGMTRYYKNYPKVVEDDEQKLAQHELAKELLDEALEQLSKYDPQTSSSKSNSGNKSMKDIYVEVGRDQRDKVIMQMWKVLNRLRDRYIKYLKEWEPDKYREHPDLQDEIVEITKK